jgi:hypothetical protein
MRNKNSRKGADPYLHALPQLTSVKEATIRGRETYQDCKK